jgi:CRP-like cAMP-binding protein
MSKKLKRARLQTADNLAAHEVDGQPVHNSILSSLPPQERDAILSKAKFVNLPTHTLLNEIAAPILQGYFMNSGLASILNVMSDGKSVEVGLTGTEGFVGLPLTVGYGTSPTRALMQIQGSAFRIAAKQLVELLPTCPTLERRLNRYAQELNLQGTQIAACNKLHPVEQRLARWLLMSQDRVGSSTFVLTQEFLSHMLGTRRASVTIAAGTLQKAGLITYKRGRVKIEKRSKLEKASCECYQALRDQMKSWSRNPA